LKRRRNKFGVSPAADRTWKGKKYASKAEMQYAMHLDNMMRAGQLSDVAEQPRYKMTKAKIVYVPDFLVTDAGGSRWCVDVKGAETDVFRLKKRLWRFYGPPMPLRLVKKTGTGWTTVETIEGPEAGE